MFRARGPIRQACTCSCCERSDNNIDKGITCWYPNERHVDNLFLSAKTSKRFFLPAASACQGGHVCGVWSAAGRVDNAANRTKFFTTFLHQDNEIQECSPNQVYYKSVPQTGLLQECSLKPPKVTANNVVAFSSRSTCATQLLQMSKNHTGLCSHILSHISNKNWLRPSAYKSVP